MPSDTATFVIDDSVVPEAPPSSASAHQSDEKLALLEGDLVLRQHEADAFVIDQCLAESLALDRVLRGDLLRTDARPEPARTGA